MASNPQPQGTQALAVVKSTPLDIDKIYPELQKHLESQDGDATEWFQSIISQLVQNTNTDANTAADDSAESTSTITT